MRISPACSRKRINMLDANGIKFNILLFDTTYTVLLDNISFHFSPLCPKVSSIAVTNIIDGKYLSNDIVILKVDTY